MAKPKVFLTGGDEIGWALDDDLALTRRSPAKIKYDVNKRDWRTPRLTLLAPVPKTRARKLLLRCVGTYLLVAGVLLVVRIIQLATS